VEWIEKLIVDDLNNYIVKGIIDIMKCEHKREKHIYIYIYIYIYI